MRIVHATVELTELQSNPVRVPIWEIPLLQELHASVTVEGESVSAREYPSPPDEYERLERKYRRFRDENGDFTDETVVGRVYGRGQRGVDELAKAMQHEYDREAKAGENEKAAQLEALRDQATELGIEFDNRWGANKLQLAIEKVLAEQQKQANAS